MKACCGVSAKAGVAVIATTAARNTMHRLMPTRRFNKYATVRRTWMRLLSRFGNTLSQAIRQS
jgi:hypothetical protein